ncbi:MAG: cytochrome c [Gemmataceae bacterium]|nr:cytochrome c [Gemmataceae bacterium]MCI0738165.1 cytochrome c [Gemmataceae bacterium]
MRYLSVSVLAIFTLTLVGHSQNPQQKIVPKLEPVAETKLLMEGLANANFRGLERQLGQKELTAQNWTFARGQALLVAETANLLMLRPPKKQGEAVWFEHAMDLRTTAAQLALSIGKKDVERSKAGMTAVANSCNRCHQSFRIPVQITPFEDEPALPKAD